MIKRSLLISSLAILVSAGFASADSYMLTDHWGGSWCDAEKSPTNTQDDLMCWAAAASNVLEWTGWGKVDSMTTTDHMFTYFQDHWTDQGGVMEYGWDWWFDGTNNSPTSEGWSRVDVAGGGFFTSETFNDYYAENWNSSSSMSAIDGYLHDGYGVTLGISKDSGGGHAITCWGYDYTAPSEYLGIWVTDSDDDKYDSTPEDELKYYAVDYDQGKKKWYIVDFYGQKDWSIDGVGAMKAPEPATGSLLIAGIALLLTRRRKTASGKSGK